MPKSKGSEMAQQRQSPRAPLHLRTTPTSESNNPHRPVRDRSPKLEEHRRSPRSPLPEVGVCNQKKRGTRVADLETRLGHAKEELRKLKEQLASAENAKRDAQLELTETKKLIPVDPDSTEQCGQEHELDIAKAENNKEQQQSAEESPAAAEENPGESSEVRVENADVKPVEEKAISEPNYSMASEATGKAEEVLEVEEKSLERYIEENAALRKELEEAKVAAEVARAKEEEMSLKVRSLEEELEQSRAKSGGLEEQLQAVERAKAELEAEMKLLRIQTDQWKKAADAAADIISGDNQMGADAVGSSSIGRRVSERVGSMDKHCGGGTGYDISSNAYLGSPMMGSESEEGPGNGKRKGAGMRMFGELWKKKGQLK